LRDSEALESETAGLWPTLRQSLTRSARRARAERARLDAFRRSVDAVSSAFPEPVVLLDYRLAVRWCNAAAEALLGCSASDHAGMLLVDVVTHPVLAEYLSGDTHDAAVELSAPADKARLLSLRLFGFGDDGGRLLVARDVTRVSKLDAVRRDFVANVSHELRTPLTVIGGYLEPLRDALAADDEWTAHLTLMAQEADRMEALIRDLTVLSRLETDGAQDAAETAVDVHALVASIVEEAAAVSGSAQHTIRANVPAGATLLGNPQELRSAVSNLVFNAVRHTQPRTRIDVDWHRDDRHTRLTVRDAGKGIAARHLPRLTERFYRVDDARSRASGGTGLGLAIVKHTLHRHDAELVVDSQVGVGTAFTCVFPNSRAGELAPADRSVESSGSL
ncbi:MAG: phosphate regulon sensor histidine kinase PhoR, partial [Pseudomonadota bacterium]